MSLLCAKRIDLYNEAFYKIDYEMSRAKQKGRMWNYEAIVSIAEHMIADTGKGDVADKVGKIMEMNAKSANEIYGFVVENGVQRFIPAKELAVDLENGVPDSAMRYIEIMREQLESIKDEMGIAPLREADPGQNRTPASVSMTALEYSQKATAYIPDMITWIIDAAAGNSLLWVQDIVTFGDKDTLAYNYLKNLVGQECLDNMGQLGKQSIRRFGIYITNVNSTKQKQDLDMVLQAAVQNKSITTSQLLLVKSIQDPKKAFLTLAYLEQKNIRDTQTAQQQQAQAQQQHEMQMLQMQLADKQKERDAMLEGKKIDYDAAIGSHTITQQGGIAKTAMKAQADADNIARQAESDMQAKFNQNTPNPPIPPFPQIPGAQSPMGTMQGMQQPQPQQMQQPQIPPTAPPGSMG